MEGKGKGKEKAVSAGAILFAKMQFQAGALPRGIWIHQGLGIADRIKEKDEGIDMVSNLNLILIG